MARHVKSIKFRIFTPGNGISKPLVVPAGKGRKFNADAIPKLAAEILRKVSDELPLEEFKSVRVAMDQYNIVWVKSKLVVGTMTEPVQGVLL